MSWEYRVMARGDELVNYEAYYYVDGRVGVYSAVPIFPAKIAADELAWNCGLHVVALEKPVSQ